LEAKYLSDNPRIIDLNNKFADIEVPEITENTYLKKSTLRNCNISFSFASVNVCHVFQLIC